MKLQKLLRQVHHWGSPLIMLPVLVIIASGLVLLLKKDIGWIQPPTQKGIAPAEVPAKSFDELFDTARRVPELELTDWRDLSRVDVKPGKGVVKFVGANNWEAQIDTETGQVLQVAYRRSDLIESLHDGSYFASWTKLWVFLPSGIILLILWGTGIYLFVLPHWKRAQKRRRRRRQGRMT